MVEVGQIIFRRGLIEVWRDGDEYVVEAYHACNGQMAVQVEADSREAMEAVVRCLLHPEKEIEK